MSKKISLVFFGSGPVAAESLRLLTNTFVIEAVITKPTTATEMKTACPDAPQFTVVDKLSLDKLIVEEQFSSKVGVLVDFGIIVSQKTIDYFPKGIVNSHFSLLPELRGADPISFAILEGKEKTGVSLMLLVEAMDEGPIISIGEQPLSGSETTLDLTTSLINLSFSLLENALPKYMIGEIKPAPQSYIQEEFGRIPSYTRKLTKTDGILNWEKPAQQLEREIRAFAGWPKSRAKFNGIDCVILKTTVNNDLSGENGKLFIHEKKLGVYCGESALIIETIKPAGKNEMNSEAFLAGYKQRLDI